MLQSETRGNAASFVADANARGPKVSHLDAVIAMIQAMVGGRLVGDGAEELAASFCTPNCVLDATATMTNTDFCRKYTGPAGLIAWARAMSAIDFSNLNHQFTLGTNGQVFVEISYTPTVRETGQTGAAMSDMMKCSVKGNMIVGAKYMWGSPAGLDALYRLPHDTTATVAWGEASIGGEAKWPLVIISSYTKFGNLAHGPRGTEAKYSMWTYRLNPVNGQLTLLTVNADDKETMNPAFSRIHPSKNVVYACTESVEENGDVFTWNVDPESGALTKVASADAQGTSTCYITIDKAQRNALVVNYWNATIVVLEVDPDTGAIGKPRSVFDPNEGREMQVSTGTRVNHSENDSAAQRNRQLDPHSHSVILDPFLGKIAFVPDLGMDLIRQLVFDPETGAITAAGTMKSGTPGKVALGPRYIEFHPTLPICYVINELSSEVAVFRFDVDAARRMIDTGVAEPTLHIVQMISTLPKGFPGSMNTCGRLAVHSSGRYVLVSNRGHDSITVYEVGLTGESDTAGHLSVKSIQHTRGATPRHFQFDSSGQWLIAANQDTDGIAVFQFNLSTGDLRFTGNSYAVPSPNFVCFMDPRKVPGV
jgi:6-phosphogluconolactonase (cycloisomerase 2 family)